MRWCRTPYIAIVQTVGLLWFLRGFFPTKVVAPGHNEFTEPNSPFFTNGTAQFSKLIFVVVDAMRSDFMFSSEDSSMSFVHSLIRTGDALPFTAYSNPPTVTLPRLKGITTGGTPSFVDAILNVADDNDNSQALSSVDSWLSQFKMQKKDSKLHFYGDDTWLKLFPPSEFFEKFEGTSSFFVSDFTEVDHNVTRHLNSEIEDEAWDVLILHYLGLDHIGHKGGPKSSFMAPKQREMDDIAQKLYSSRVSGNNDTLLVLMGDHGMNDIGNHGGSSPGETSPGLILASPKFRTIGDGQTSPLSKASEFQYYTSISQIDLVPTISALFGLPIPMNNFGIIMKNILPLWPEGAQRKKVLLENCKQFYDLLNGHGSTQEDSKFYDQYQSLLDVNANEEDNYYKFLRDVQDSLTKSATNYSYEDISFGFFLMLLATLAAFWRFTSTIVMLKGSRFLLLSFGTFCILYGLTFHGSSLIEEEHQIWWFFTVTVVAGALLLNPNNAIDAFVLLVCIRLVRSWSNSGQKFETESTFANVLVSSPSLQWALVIFTYLAPLVSFFREAILSSETRVLGKKFQLLKFLSCILWAITGWYSLSFKLLQTKSDGLVIPTWVYFISHPASSNLVHESATDKNTIQELGIQLSQTFYGLLFLSFVLFAVMIKSKRSKAFSLQSCAQLLSFSLIHQTRIVNIPIFLLFPVMKACFKNYLRRLGDFGAENQVIVLSFGVLCFQNLSFFSIGSTNSLATVDLSNAYNGIREYNLILVGLMTFISNFALPIYWSFAGLELIESISSEPKKSEVQKLFKLKSFLTMSFYSIAAINLVASCVNLRFHLFIWSVFSPKLLYFLSWELLMNMAIDGAICKLLLHLSS